MAVNTWFVTAGLTTIWFLCALLAHAYDRRDTRDARLRRHKRRLRRKAKRHLCYPLIHRMEEEIYGKPHKHLGETESRWACGCKDCQRSLGY